jgi:prepilin-type N-terminal cleavage/methylation domain-containing protein
MSGRRGFTLLEVIVAVTIAGIVVLAARQLYTGVVDGATAARVARAALDRRMNGQRWLKATLLSLAPPFDGSSDRMAFNSWQLTQGEWFEDLKIELRRDGSEFIATSGDQRFELRDGVVNVTFDYLLEPGAETKWVNEWISPVSAPLAVRIRIAGCGRNDAACTDTLLFLVKERG